MKKKPPSPTYTLPHRPPWKVHSTVLLLAIQLAGPTARGEPPAAPPQKPLVVRLVNITIPPDSRLRHSDNLSKPPALYIELFENGTRIGTSTAERGWQPDYPAVAQNQWTLKADTKTRYLIKVWDSNWGPDDLAFDIAGCKAADLQGLVRERGAVSEATDRLATVEFEKVEETALPTKKSESP